MFRNRRIRLCAFFVMSMTFFSLPKILMAHPGHSLLTGFVADALLLNTGGCDDTANSDMQ